MAMPDLGLTLDPLDRTCLVMDSRLLDAGGGAFASLVEPWRAVESGTETEVLDISLLVVGEAGFELSKAFDVAEDEVEGDLGDDVFRVFVGLAAEEDQAIVWFALTVAPGAGLVDLEVATVAGLVP
jgi:hypothetical protein